MEVYLDNSATTKVFPQVAELMTKVMCEDYGNPSSMHRKGVEGERYIRYARETLAKLLKVSEKEILFTSGGTESDNTAIIGCAMANNRRGRHLVTTKIEHPAVLQTMHYLETQGFRVTYLPVDKSGRVRLEDLQNAITPETILVSMMLVNNEIGSIQPIEEAGALIKRMNPNILFHVDAVQGFGKIKIYPKRMNIDLMSVSSHKIHGPKGVGFLYVGERVKIMPITYGGGQQKNLRSGTENVPGIVGLGEAIRTYPAEGCAHMAAMKRRLWEGLQQAVPAAKLNGPALDDPASAPHVLNVSLQPVRSQTMLFALEGDGVYVSAGSACAAHKQKVSGVLTAMGLSTAEADCALRFSLCPSVTEEEIDYTVQTVKKHYDMLKAFVRR